MSSRGHCNTCGESVTWQRRPGASKSWFPPQHRTRAQDAACAIVFRSGGTLVSTRAPKVDGRYVKSARAKGASKAPRRITTGCPTLVTENYPIGTIAAFIAANGMDDLYEPAGIVVRNKASGETLTVKFKSNAR